MDMNVAEEAKKELILLTSKYALCDIYNCDESGFFWGAMPTRSLATKPRKGHKKNKSRITALFAVNADGSDKRKITFVGKAERPRCFKGKQPSEFGFEYHNNQKAWMNLQLFAEWVRKLNEDMKSQDRRILLLLDNFSGRMVDDEEFSHVRIKFLPPNTTSSAT